jgi:putative ABC transport system substrate-binding protein
MRENLKTRKRTWDWKAALALGVVFALLLSGCAKQPKVYRVGVLNAFPPFADIADGFIAEMTELGYTEGENIVYDVQEAGIDPAEAQRVLEQFVADEVDLIFAFATEGGVAAKAATEGTDIPVVFAMAAVEGNGLVESVRQPGGNVTGVRFPGPENINKRFELLRGLVPQLKRLYVTYNPEYPANHTALEVLRPATEAAGMTLVEVPVSSPDEIAADLQARAGADDIGMDAILILPDDISQSPAGTALIGEFATQHQVPIGGALPFWLDVGALFSYTTENTECGKLAAPLADKILKGTPAGTIPVVSPEQYLRLNYGAAQALGLTVPDGMLSQAVAVVR